MYRIAFVLALLALVLAAALAQRPVENADATVAGRTVVTAAPGRVEGSADPVEIGASISGIVEHVAVRQGDRVSAGQVLVRIACDDIEAQLAGRVAEHAAAEASHQRLVNGPRREDLQIAQAELRLSEARASEAQQRAVRSATLGDESVVDQASRDAATRDAAVAVAEVDAARLRLRLLQLGTRAEELAEAKARVLAARHAIDATRSELGKCDVRSPVEGIVLRKHVSEGELISLFFPRPLVTVAEIQKYRVRAELDEHDVARVTVGQAVEVAVNTSDAGRLRGRVASIAPVMGRRQILTSDPADKSDRDVVEVVVDLETSPTNLPIGLRVAVIFLNQTR
jgi:HlyD family secretion protein